MKKIKSGFCYKVTFFLINWHISEIMTIVFLRFLINYFPYKKVWKKSQTPTGPDLPSQSETDMLTYDKSPGTLVVHL